MANRKESTRGFGGGAKIVYTRADNGKTEELYGHCCDGADAAEEYIKLLFGKKNPSNFRVVYDEVKRKA